MSLVLVVDDDDDLREMIVEVLEAAGLEVVEARNGVEALARVAERMPGCILLDMRMPVMDGWTFARAIAERSIELKILVMTAAQDARAWAAEIHADGYVAKPFELRHLLAEVERLCTVT